MTTLPRWTSLKSPRFTSMLAVLALASLGAAGCTISSEPVENFSGAVDTVTVQVLPIGTTTTNLARGITRQLRAIPTNSVAQGANFIDVPVTWSTSNASQATVDGNGLVTTVAGGDVTITATAGGKSGTFVLNIQHAVSAVNITGGGVTIRQEGAVALTATVIAGGAAAVGRTVTWSTSNAAVATVSATGVVAGVTNGTATITATSEGVSGTTLITVSGSPIVANVTVAAPAGAAMDFQYAGQVLNFTQTPRAGSGTVITGTTPVWASTNMAVATVTQAGVVTVIGPGSTNITATVNNGIGVNVTGSLSLTSVPVLVSGATVAVPTLAAGTGFALYALVVPPAGLTSFTITSTGGTGDADLYVFAPGVTPSAFNGNAFPPWTNTTALSGNSGNGESIARAAPAAGAWRVYAHAWAGGGQVAGFTMTATMVP